MIRKLITVVLVSLSFTLTYPQGKGGDEGKKVLEKRRQEIQKVEQQKQKEAEAARRAEKAAEKEREKVLDEIRQKRKKPLKTGASIERDDSAEKELSKNIEVEKTIGEIKEETKDFLAVQIDEGHKKLQSNTKAIENLLSENEKLQEYLSSLGSMKSKINKEV